MRKQSVSLEYPVDRYPLVIALLLQSMSLISSLCFDVLLCQYLFISYPFICVCIFLTLTSNVLISLLLKVVFALNELAHDNWQEHQKIYKKMPINIIVTNIPSQIGEILIYFSVISFPNICTALKQNWIIFHWNVNHFLPQVKFQC